MTTLGPIEALRLSYAQRLPAKLRTLERAVRAWYKNPSDAALLGRARDIAHRLRGTTGTYGFAEVSSVVGTIEAALLGGDAAVSASILPFFGVAQARAKDVIAALHEGGAA